MPMSIQKYAVSLAVLAAAVPAGAAAELAADTGGSFIETVTVTAQKREQNPIEVPFALTAYSGDFLETVHLQEFDKLSLYVPGFEVQNQSPNNPGFVMRGITSDSNDATQEPRVSVFADGVSASQSRGSYFELFDVERIEVAKGPQSTLFGRSALIGGVNVITRKADPEAFDAAFSAEAGDFGYYMIDGMVNIPLAGDVAVRASGRYKSRNGYVKNLLGGADFDSVDTGAARLSLAWTPSDAFCADLIFNFQRDAPSGTSFKSGTLAPTDPDTGEVLGTTDHNTGAALATVSGFENGRKLGLDRTLYSGAARLSYKLGGGYALSSITAYRRYEAEEVFDPDGSSLPIAVFAEDARGDQFSHEMRINYDQGGTVSWFGGVSYFYANNSSRIPMQFDEQMLLTLLTGQMSAKSPQAAPFFDSAAFTYGYAPAFLQGMAATYGVALDSSTATGIAANLDSTHWEQYETYGKTKSFDVYGDVTVRATDALEFEAGLRYTHDDKTSAYAGKTTGRSILGGVIGALGQSASVRDALLYYLSQSYISAVPYDSVPNFGIAAQPSANNGDKVSRNYGDDGFAWRATARYALEENSSLYATYARGRRPKVLAASSPAVPYADPTFTAIDAETVDSYEVGYKTLAAGGKLRLDASLYRYGYKNFQTTVLKNAAQVATNAGKAKAYGAELAVDLSLAPWADVFGTYAYSHARFGGDSIYDGNRFRLTPDHKLSLGASLRQAAFGGTFTLLPTFTWQSKVYFDDDNDIASEQTSHIVADTVRDEFQGDYGLFNLRLTWQQKNGPWGAGVFVTNLFDRKFIKDAGNTGDYFGIPTFISGEPRFFGVSISAKFH
jgi:iron complex outermembrane recepter protein